MYYLKDSLPDKYAEKILAYLIAESTIKKIIIAAYWARRGVSKDQLLPIIHKLQAAGKQVLLTDDVPDFTFDASRCKYGRPFRLTNSCLEDRDVFIKRYVSYYPDIQEIAAEDPDIQVIHTSQYLCDSPYCFMSKEGKLLYRDEHHLNINGSRYVGARIVRDFPSLND